MSVFTFAFILFVFVCISLLIIMPKRVKALPATIREAHTVIISSCARHTRAQWDTPSRPKGSRDVDAL